MKKATWNKTGTRQLVNSGYRLFDKQTNCITTGNVYASTKYSGFIRPYTETKCNNHDFAKGELMHTDLRPFRRYGIPSYIYDILTDQTRAGSYILYMFFVTDSDKSIRPVCWVVTDKMHKLITSTFVHLYGTNWLKPQQVLAEVLPYITEAEA